jgi:hypothetical protein
VVIHVDEGLGRRWSVRRSVQLPNEWTHVASHPLDRPGRSGVNDGRERFSRDRVVKQGVGNPAIQADLVEQDEAKDVTGRILGHPNPASPPRYARGQPVDHHAGLGVEPIRPGDQGLSFRASHLPNPQTFD